MKYLNCATMKKIQALVGVLPLFFLWTQYALAQVTVSPTTMFFENNFSSFTVINNSPIAQDVIIDFTFGYPVADESGEFRIFYGDSLELKNRDITPYVRAFPRSMTIQPGQRQTVRVNIRPPATLPDGVNWARLKVISSSQAAEISTENSDAVSAQLNLVFEQIFSIYHIKGNAFIDMSVDDVRYSINGDQRLLIYDTRNVGNAPFVGSITLEILESISGRLVHSARSVTSIFTDESRNFFLPESLSPGTYKVVIQMTSRRPDIPERNSFQMTPVRQEFQIEIE
jgi:hypothetical protein